VTRLTMLATADGQWVLPGTPEFIAALGDPDPDYDSILFAVKNLGFIKFELIERSIAEIELHPRNVVLPALLAVQQQLFTSQVKLFRIKYFDQVWHSEITSSLEQALARLSELCAPVFTPALTDRFLVEPRDYSVLFDDETNPMRPLLQKWRMSFGHFDPGILSLALRQNLLNRMMIIGVKPREQEPVFRFIGEGHRWLDTRYQVSAIGEKIVNQPDRQYGEWVSEFYKSVASSGQPRYDLVTAAIETVKTAARPYTAHYERLLLPWKTPSDEVFVTMLSRLLEDRSSPVLAPVALDSSDDKKLAKSS